MRRADRLMKLIQLLRDGDLHRAEDLARATDVSLRTVYRDMETLAASGVPIEGERGEGYRGTAAITLPPLNLTITEVEALHIGLQHPDQFGSIGAFSAAPPRGDLEMMYEAGLTASRNLLWIRCGRRDFLRERNQKFVDRLRRLDVQHDFEETAGGHSWNVWRQYLPEFCKRFPVREQKRF